MSFYVWCELVCRTCAESNFGYHSCGTIDRRGMKKEAIARGWKLIGREWYCRNCKHGYEAATQRRQG